MPETLQQEMPASCLQYLEPDNLRPFSLRHATQQASIAGNLRRVGLLQVISHQIFSCCVHPLCVLKLAMGFSRLASRMMI